MDKQKKSTHFLDVAAKPSNGKVISLLANIIDYYLQVSNENNAMFD